MRRRKERNEDEPAEFHYCKSVKGRVELFYLTERAEMQVTRNGEITFQAAPTTYRKQLKTLRK